MEKIYLAVDIGAGSGRVIAGLYDGKTLRLEEVNRFGNTPVHLPSGIHWNLTGLYQSIQEGLAKAVRRWGKQVVGLGVDTWGVDYGLLCPHGTLLGIPYAYRDSRTDGVIEQVDNEVSLKHVYAKTGIQVAFFNTLFQLVAERNAQSVAMREAASLLFTPDLINYLLTGVQATERTIASTSQLYNPCAQDWDRGLIAQLGLPERIFGQIVDPGIEIGTTEVSGHSLKVFTVGSHDTASAVAAAPLRSANSAYLSSGTWSLLGAELDAPVISPETAEANFTNEVGVGRTIRFLKNITGMWLIQQCKEVWDQEQAAPIDYGDLTDQARARESFQAFVDPDDAAFVAPGNMPQRIRDYLQKTGQSAPAAHTDIARILFESLALKYRHTFTQLEQLTGRKFESLHVVGGGCKNAMLNQFTANALKIEVVAGPAEATSAGNILLQLMADGEVKTLAEGRELIARSMAVQTFEPRSTEVWDEAYLRYTQTLGLK